MYYFFSIIKTKFRATKELITFREKFTFSYEEEEDMLEEISTVIKMVLLVPSR